MIEIANRAQLRLFIWILFLLAVTLVFVSIGFETLGVILMYAFISSIITALIGRDIFSLKRQQEARVEISRARLVELKRTEAAAEAELAIAKARVEERLAKAEEREAKVTALENAVTIEERRFKRLKEIMEREMGKLKISALELKSIHGGVIPEEQGVKLFENFLNALKEEDGPAAKTMFTNPSGLTREPRPIRWPENKLHALLEQGVDQKLIYQDQLDAVLCLISGQVMQDPVLGEDGRTYDRFCLENLYLALPGRYPMDRREMTVDPRQLPRDTAMYDRVQALVKQCQSHIVDQAPASYSLSLY